LELLITFCSQLNKIDFDDDDDDYFDDEDEEEIQWSFERRTATLRDTKIATEAFLAACTDLKKSVSTKVDVLLNNLPDVYDSKFETKYRKIQRQLQELFSKKRNKSKQQTNEKR